MPLVLGVDASTDATKVEVRDADDGRLVAVGTAPHVPLPRPPRSEQDPVVWWEALVAAVHATGLRDVAAIAVAAQSHGLVPLDAAGAVLRPAKLWNDLESAPEAAAMVREFGAARWARTTGCVPVAAHTVTKIAWLARHEQDVLDRLHTALVPHDYLTYRLTGRAVTDRGDASGTGYWSPFEDRWRPDLLEAIVGPVAGGWLERLPEVLGPSEPSDWVTASVHELLGLRGRPLCGAGTGESMAAALAVGLDVGEVAVSIGTSGAVFTVATTPRADPSGWVSARADGAGRHLPLVATSNAALVTAAVGRLLGVDAAGLDDLALAGTPGADGVVLVPHLDGERAPDRPGATGVIRGLRSGSAREDVARAAFEGVVCSLLEALAAIQRAGVGTGDGPLVLVGDGGRSAAYRQILADLAGTPVRVPDLDDAAATGACVQAAACLAGCGPLEVATAWGFGGGGRLVEPGPAVDRDAVRAAYRAAVDRESP